MRRAPLEKAEIRQRKKHPVGRSDTSLSSCEVRRPEALFSLQRQVGNRQVQRVLSHQGLERKQAQSLGGGFPVTFKGELLVPGEDGSWFHCEFTCTIEGHWGTPVDNTRVGPYSTPAGFIPSVLRYTYKLTPLEEYRKELLAAFEQQRKELMGFHRWPASGALTPVYIEFDLITLFRDPSKISRWFGSAELVADLVSGDYTGGPQSALEDLAYGLLAGKLVGKMLKAAHKMPKGKNAKGKLEFIEQVTKLGLKKAFDK